MDIDKMAAGEELDKLVAENVFGWRWVENSRKAKGFACTGLAGDICATEEQFKKWDKDNSKDKGWVNPTIPSYSTDLAAAWKVVERFTRYSIEKWPEGIVCCVQFGEGDFIKSAIADTAPLAICRVALKAVAKEATL